MGYKAFVSSTYVDLKDHRARVIAALRSSGITVDPMEEWTADTDEPKEVSTDRMRDCDFCVLLVGARRGHVPEGERLSITQLAPAYYELEQDSELQRWRAELLEHSCVATFNADSASVDSPVRDAVARWIQSQAWPEVLKSCLEGLAAAHGSLRFLGIGIYRNADDRPIDEVFVEPRAATSYISPDTPVDKWSETRPIRDLLVEQPRLVLLGDPGSGKSTVISWITWNLARQQPNELKEQLGSPIPLFILRELDLDRVSGWNDLLRAGLRHWSLRLLGRKRYTSDLEELVSSGRTLFLFDGLDEVSNVGQRKRLANAIREGMSQLPSCRWLLTSRIVGFDEIDKLLLQPGPREKAIAQKHYVSPFDDGQIQDFARNWHATRERSPVMAKRDAANLVEAIHGNPSTHRLARIPNLLTMMALIHRQEANLPNGRALLYTKIADAYIQSIDEQRHIARLGYSLLEQKRLLGRVGFEMQRRRGVSKGEEKEILVSGHDLRGWLLDAMRASFKTESAGSEEEVVDAFLDEICRRSGLLIPKAEDLFAFSHLSFQEYFAAVLLLQQFKLPERKRARGEGIAGAAPGDLAKYVKASDWKETLVLLVELTVAEEPDFSEDLLACLFGEDFSRLNPGSETGESLAPRLRLGVLVATLAVNPHSGLREAGLQRNAIRACCELELAYQRGVRLFTRAPSILPALFQSAGEERSDVWAILIDALRANRTRSLELYEAPVQDASPLGAYSELEQLSLSNTQIRDVSMLANMRSLRVLSLDDNQDLDIATLPTLASLEILGLAYLDAPDLTRIQHLQNLRALSLHLLRQPIALEPLLELKKLRFLLAIGGSALDFACLENHPSLTYVSVHGHSGGEALGDRLQLDGAANFSEIPELAAILDDV
jgi:internalin A